MHYLDDLNPEQKEAVLHTEGPLLVVAGAGTGKTKTLTYRILHLINQGISPENILAITFTNKAAQEMRERLDDMLSEDGEQTPLMLTFHALGVRILREQHHALGIHKYFNIYDNQDSLSLIKRIMKAEGLDPKEWDPRTLLRIISRAKNNGKTVSSFEVAENNPASRMAKKIWQEYETIKHQEHALDFDDLLSETYRLLHTDSEIRAYCQKRWLYILVDEYQDTNTIQYQIVKLLSEKYHNICAVGDSDQNIYSWRGADMRNILNFEKDFPGAKVVILSQNYRSTQNILDAADAVISKNTERIEKKLVTKNESGKKILLYGALNEYREAEFIARTIQSLFEEGRSPKDIAVLIRTNFQSRVLEEACMNFLIPYQVIGVKFFERKEVKDVMAYLKAAFNRNSLSDIKRIINEPKRGLGKVSLAKIFAGDHEQLPEKAKISYLRFQKLLDDILDYAHANPPHETIRYIIEHSGLGNSLREGDADDQERLENMKELASYAKKYEDQDMPYDLFFEQVALLSDQDSLGTRKEEHNTVKIMTIHASKGLEFPVVFVAGLEQGLFPGQRDDAESKYEHEEERRLCYVALTRAKEELVLSYAYLRTIYGQQRINETSEFVHDVPKEILEQMNELSDEDEDAGETETFYLEF